MSSGVDQHTKPIEPPGTQLTGEGEYAYTSQAVAMQAGYHPGAAILSGQTTDSAYQIYGAAGAASGAYDPAYMAFTGGMMDPSAVWSTDPSALAYGGYGPAEYLQYGSDTTTSSAGQYGIMPNQYDYSAVSWLPTSLDYGAWGQSGVLPIQPQAKSRFIDYSNRFYDPMGMGVDSGVAVGQASGSSVGSVIGRYSNTGDVNGYQNIDQAFKSMQLSPQGPAPSAVPVNGEERCNGNYNEAVSTTSTTGGGDVGQTDTDKHSTVTGNSAPSEAAPVKKSWANIASQPAAKTTVLPRPKPNQQPNQLPRGMLAVSAGVRQEAMMNSQNSSSKGQSANKSQGAGNSTSTATPPVPGQYNPKEFDLNAKGARFFVIKSFSEDDIHRSIKYSIWCSTEYGNKRLDVAYREREGKGPVYLFFSVNGSGHFCGVAVMTSPVDYQNSSSVWAQDKWKGTFSVQWIFVKDVPNSQLRHIRLENNEGKPVTNSRDTQEVPVEKGRQVLRIIHQYRFTTSIFDDFQHYEEQLTGDAVNNNSTNGAVTTSNNNNDSASSNNNGVNGKPTSNSSKAAASSKSIFSSNRQALGKGSND